MILVQRLQALIQLVNKWDKTYSKVGKEVKEDPKFVAQSAQIKELRSQITASVKEAHEKEFGADNDFSKLDQQRKTLEGLRAKIHRILSKKDLNARPIFMSKQEYEVIRLFLDNVHTFQSTFRSSDQQTQDTFGQITNEYDQRVENHFNYFNNLLAHIGILMDEDPVEDADSSVDTWDDTATVITPDTTVVDTTETDVSVDTNTSTTTTTVEDTIEDHSSTSSTTTTETTNHTSTPIQEDNLSSNNTGVNSLLAIRKKATPAYNAASEIYASAKAQASEGSLIVMEMTAFNRLFPFMDLYKDFDWKFNKSADAVQREFESLTNGWAAQTKQLFDELEDNWTQIKMTEPGTNRLASPSPIVNHNTVDTITGEDPKLGAIYQKMDRFVQDDEGRQFKKKEVKPEDLFVKGADDKDSSGIDPYDIIQGALGNCYFMCSLSAIAKSAGGPQKIKDMITYNGDGTYTVKLYRPVKTRTRDELKNRSVATTVGFEAVDVVVGADVWYDTNEDSALYARSQDKNEMWPLIIEKAFAKLMGGYDEIDAGFSQEAYAVLTGTPRRSFDFSSEMDAALKAIEKAVAENMGATFATPPNMAAEYATDENGQNLKGNAGELIMLTDAEDGGERIVAGHAYALDTVSNGIITLVNPHGKNHITKLPVNSMFKYFSRVVIDY
jgi:hypothetical protein